MNVWQRWHRKSICHGWKHILSHLGLYDYCTCHRFCSKYFSAQYVGSGQHLIILASSSWSSMNLSNYEYDYDAMMLHWVICSDWLPEESDKLRSNLLLKEKSCFCSSRPIKGRVTVIKITLVFAHISTHCSQHVQLEILPELFIVPPLVEFSCSCWSKRICPAAAETRNFTTASTNVGGVVILTIVAKSCIKHPYRTHAAGSGGISSGSPDNWYNLSSSIKQIILTPRYVFTSDMKHHSIRFTTFWLLWQLWYI